MTIPDALPVFSEGSDWRAVRAQLVASARAAEGGEAPPTADDQPWAHRLPRPEQVRACACGERGSHACCGCNSPCLPVEAAAQPAGCERAFDLAAALGSRSHRHPSCRAACCWPIPSCSWCARLPALHACAAVLPGPSAGWLARCCARQVFAAQRALGSARQCSPGPPPAALPACEPGTTEQNAQQYFWMSVILVCEHSERGSWGLILNRCEMK